MVAQAEVHLSITGIHGNHFGGAVLQHTVAEASGGSADVETDFAAEIDSPVLESLLQLEPATAHVAQILAQQAQNRRRAGVNQCARLPDLLFVYENFSRQNEGLRTLARWRKPSLHE